MSVPSAMTGGRTALPIVPVEVLKQFNVHERNDDRLKAAARLLQALWLQRHDIPTGHVRVRGGGKRRLGSRLNSAAALAGRNFLTPDIARYAHQMLAYRERGAFIDVERGLGNALSSTGLCLNLAGILAGDLDLAACVLRQLLPDQDIDTVTAIRIEHSPGRDQPDLTSDRSAHDCCILFTRRRRSRHPTRTGVLCIEVKYTEGLFESAPYRSGALDDLAEASGLYMHPRHAALRTNPLQQLFREHLLAQAAVIRGDWPSAVFVSLAPAANERVQRQADRYRSFLAPTLPGHVPFAHVTLDAMVAALERAGAPEAAAALYERYLDWGEVDRLVGAAVQARVAKWPLQRSDAPPFRLISQAA
ncbi:PGN_0703 family putative restriction endonuclease [Sphingomonas sp.]|uniref:PGN_0703 family putative restriction endonuclease n=1 Tax=Sphingomonas sp. TaxID=28214 RepID=UPI003CC64E86